MFEGASSQEQVFDEVKGLVQLVPDGKWDRFASSRIPGRLLADQRRPRSVQGTTCRSLRMGRPAAGGCRAPYLILQALRAGPSL